jgi:proteasome lid subunit RPN8/RPN11
MDIPSDDCLQEIKDYLLVDPTVERGCLVTKDGRVIPFQNTALNQTALIRMGPDDFGIMVDLVNRGELLGWAHSHPHWMPYPSFIDIKMHQLPVQMIIYSITDDSFGIYTTEEIMAMESAYDQISPNLEIISPELWKPQVAQLYRNKELINA